MSDLMEESENLAALLRVYGSLKESPTENELWVGCKDAASTITRLRARVKELEEERRSVEHIKALIAGLKMGELRAHQKALTEALRAVRARRKSELWNRCIDCDFRCPQGQCRTGENGCPVLRVIDAALREHGWKEEE